MRRLPAWIAGTAGGLAAYRLLRRRRDAVAPESAVDPRAEELRARLDEARRPPAAAPDPEPEPPAPPAEPEDPEARRRAVHERGRAALEEMGGGEASEKP